jgi:hypothetical protein
LVSICATTRTWKPLELPTVRAHYEQPNPQSISSRGGGFITGGVPMGLGVQPSE